MLKAGVLEIMLYGCVTWSPRACHYDTLRRAAAEEVRAGRRHAVVCPSMTGRIKERIAQSKRARAGSLALVG